MSGSVVFYRFKAQKEASTVTFEGTGISVWDLKKEILAENKLGRGADFDFAIMNADTNEGMLPFLADYSVRHASRFRAWRCLTNTLVATSVTNLRIV